MSIETTPRRRAGLLAVWLLLAVGGCAPVRTPVRAPVRIATDATFPPFHFVDPDGQITGFDVETARAVLERAGFRAVVVRTDSYAALFDGLERGDHDLIAATTGITPEREERYSFSPPYFVTAQVGVVRIDFEGEGPADLRGRRVAAGEGTTSARAAAALGAIGVPMPKGVDAVDALRAGDVDAIIADEFHGVDLARKHAGFRVLPHGVAPEAYGLVLRKDDATLRSAVTEALLALRRDGGLAALQARFGLARGADWPVRVPDGSE